MISFEPLTEREYEVLSFVAQGLTNAQIAETLCISEGTVRSHLNTIYAKLGVSAGLSARILAALKVELLVYVGPQLDL